MALNNPAPLSCQNIVSFDANKTPNITAISGCNIGCRFCKCLTIKLICGKTGTLFDPSKPVNIIELHSRQHPSATVLQQLSDTRPHALLRGRFAVVAKLIIFFGIKAMNLVKNCKCNGFCNGFCNSISSAMQRQIVALTCIFLHVATVGLHCRHAMIATSVRFHCCLFFQAADTFH